MHSRYVESELDYCSEMTKEISTSGSIVPTTLLGRGGNLCEILWKSY
jgi:hypothetical protein